MNKTITTKQLIKMLNTIEASVKFYYDSNLSKIQNMNIPIKDDNENELVITSLYPTDDMDGGDNGTIYIARNIVTGEEVRDFLGSLANEEIIALYNYFK